jgi:hypothetical protein
LGGLFKVLGVLLTIFLVGSFLIAAIYVIVYTVFFNAVGC